MYQWESLRDLKFLTESKNNVNLHRLEGIFYWDRSCITQMVVISVNQAIIYIYISLVLIAVKNKSSLNTCNIMSLSRGTGLRATPPPQYTSAPIQNEQGGQNQIYR